MGHIGPGITCAQCLMTCYSHSPGIDAILKCRLTMFDKILIKLEPITITLMFFGFPFHQFNFGNAFCLKQMVQIPIFLSVFAQ